jgi:hypothetical protein
MCASKKEVQNVFVSCQLYDMSFIFAISKSELKFLKNRCKINISIALTNKNLQFRLSHFIFFKNDAMIINL